MGKGEEGVWEGCARGTARVLVRRLEWRGAWHARAGRGRGWLARAQPRRQRTILPHHVLSELVRLGKGDERVPGRVVVRDTRRGRGVPHAPPARAHGDETGKCVKQQLPLSTISIAPASEVNVAPNVRAIFLAPCVGFRLL